MSGLADTEAHLKALMLASLGGDAAAYRTLLSELGRHLQRYYARRLGSGLASSGDDLVQETLMAIHLKRLTYDRSQPFTVWLHAIARYKLIDHFRRQRIRVTVPLDDDAALFARDDAEDASVRMDLAKALDTVPPRSRELIRQVRVEGASIAEAAERSGMSESAVKVSIHRGLKALTARFSGGVGNDR